MRNLASSGTPGDDTLTGTSGDDTIEGYGGDDLLIAGGLGEGFDSYDGGSGFDTIYAHKALQVQGVENVERIDVSGPSVELIFAPADPVSQSFSLDLRSVDTTDLLVIRTGSSERGGYEIFDNDDAHVMCGSPGRDELYGMGGADTLNGGADIDGLYAGSGNDLVLAGDGHDAMTGDAGDDTLMGEAGYDYLFGDVGDDYLDGGDDDDILVGGEGADTLVGGAGADSFYAPQDDVVGDFSRADGDKIALPSVGWPNSWTFIGEDEFSGTAFEVRYEESLEGAVILGDWDGDGVADYSALLIGQASVIASDFLF